jgi:hypothetical protein
MTSELPHTGFRSLEYKRQLLQAETHTKRQETLHGYLLSLLGDGDKEIFVLVRL